MTARPGGGDPAVYSAHTVRIDPDSEKGRQVGHDVSAVLAGCIERLTAAGKPPTDLTPQP